MDRAIVLDLSFPWIVSKVTEPCIFHERWYVHMQLCENPAVACVMIVVSTIGSDRHVGMQQAAGRSKKKKKESDAFKTQINPLILAFYI